MRKYPPLTPRRTVRVPDDIWLPAMKAAEDRGDNLSEVIRKALIRYTKRQSSNG